MPGSGSGFFVAGYNGSAYTSGIDKIHLPTIVNAAELGNRTSIGG